MPLTYFFPIKRFINTKIIKIRLQLRKYFKENEKVINFRVTFDLKTNKREKKKGAFKSCDIKMVQTAWNYSYWEKL
jgi:hypothetical protein